MTNDTVSRPQCPLTTTVFPANSLTKTWIFCSLPPPFYFVRSLCLEKCLSLWPPLTELSVSPWEDGFVVVALDRMAPKETVKLDTDKKMPVGAAGATADTSPAAATICVVTTRNAAATWSLHSTLARWHPRTKTRTSTMSRTWTALRRLQQLRTRSGRRNTHLQLQEHATANHDRPPEGEGENETTSKNNGALFQTCLSLQSHLSREKKPYRRMHQDTRGGSRTRQTLDTRKQRTMIQQQLDPTASRRNPKLD